MVVWTLLIVFFWAIVPGLITGWMRRERGRSFLPGLLVGIILGPLGILITLILLYFGERQEARRSPKRGRAVRVFYEIPVVGRLHVSTVWALAGLATFLCLWMVGGIGYEFYKTSLLPAESDADVSTAGGTHEKKASETASVSTNAPSAEAKLTTSAQANTSSQTRTALIGSISTQPGQTATSSARTETSSTQISQPALTDAGSNGTSSSQPVVIAPAPPTKTVTAPTVQSDKALPTSREAAVSEVTRSLSSSGHKVHAALSGDAQTSTLSLTGATLTREAGNQLLGNHRLREALKAAGVRIVVMVNGQESWTYML